jgi:hypothetical protein
MGKLTEWTITLAGASALVAGPLTEAREACDQSGAVECRRMAVLPDHGNEEGAPEFPAWAGTIIVRGTDTSTDSRPSEDVPHAFWDQDDEYAEAHAADVNLIISTGTQVSNSGWD